MKIDRQIAALSVALAVALALALAPALAASPGETERDPRAVELAERTLEAMGGAEAWRSTRFLRFDFFGFRLHHWDRHTGRHRLEGKTREGQEYVVLHDLDSREGQAWLDGEHLEGEAAAEWLERAYGAWVNDAYWLVMPYKLLDPGVHLGYAGEEQIEGRTYDVLHLSFDGVGLTPGDQYWAYLDRESGLMHRWAYHLQGWEAERPKTVWAWEEWAPYGDVLLASKRRNLEDGRETELGELAVFETLPDSVFESPAPVARTPP